jgi:steroid delta-isomerase-like uncharacterized protein
MSAEQLQERYRRYIHCLNEQRWSDLGEFVHERIVYNEQPMSRDDYRNMLVEVRKAVPDQRFNVALLVADNDHVAARLEFHCTPRSAFLGHEPNGRTICFAEHAFYRFEAGRIRQVWSLIDHGAIERQLR